MYQCMYDYQSNFTLSLTVHIFIPIYTERSQNSYTKITFDRKYKLFIVWFLEENMIFQVLNYISYFLVKCRICNEFKPKEL